MTFRHLLQRLTLTRRVGLTLFSNGPGPSHRRHSQVARLDHFARCLASRRLIIPGSAGIPIRKWKAVKRLPSRINLSAGPNPDAWILKVLRVVPFGGTAAHSEP